MLAAIILAAGESTRMGSPKALLCGPDGRPFVARIVRAFVEAAVEEIVVVTGNRHDAIVAGVAADAPPVTPRFARNADPSRGQLSSLWTGLDAVDRAELDGILVIPVDVPLVRAATIEAVVQAWRRTRALIVRPAIDARHGHPVLFARAVFDDLRRAPLDSGAKAVLRARARDVVNVPVDDEGALFDVDTPADYEALSRVWARHTG